MGKRTHTPPPPPFLQLEVHMSPWQFREGYAERIGKLLADGAFVGCPGRWRVHRRLAAVDVKPVEQVTVEVHRVTFELEPLDALACVQAANQVL
jgi:hypothetical protein